MRLVGGHDEHLPRGHPMRRADYRYLHLPLKGHHHGIERCRVLAQPLPGIEGEHRHRPLLGSDDLPAHYRAALRLHHVHQRHRHTDQALVHSVLHPASIRQHRLRYPTPPSGNRVRPTSGFGQPVPRSTTERPLHRRFQVNLMAHGHVNWFHSGPRAHGRTHDLLSIHERSPRSPLHPQRSMRPHQ